MVNFNLPELKNYRMENYVDLSKIHSKDMIPGFKAKMIHTETMTISFWEVTKGSVLPKHQHHHEQVSQVIEGEFEFTIDGKTQVIAPGKVVIIPSHAIHSGIAISDCKIMDIFSPVREDYKVE
jgi:quercetin dioxygenase-like cupin family protein